MLFFVEQGDDLLLQENMSLVGEERNKYSLIQEHIFLIKANTLLEEEHLPKGYLPAETKRYLLGLESIRSTSTGEAVLKVFRAVGLHSSKGGGGASVPRR